MKTQIIVAFFLLTSVCTTAQNSKSSFGWPDNKKAAVCLTFDDGLDCHLDIAVPLLDSYKMKGTFYCTGKSLSLSRRMSEWRKIAASGHELGNHSLFHPCDGSQRDWVKPEYDLRNYTRERLRLELFTANTLLKAVDGKTIRTFGYTCSNYKTKGDSSFVDIVRTMFDAARTDGPIPSNMNNVDVYFMPSWCVNDNTGQELINYVKEAKEKGTIATFMFHSVGGGYLNVSRQALNELLSYLKENEDIYWVDTFHNVTHYISQEQKK